MAATRRNDKETWNFSELRATSRSPLRQGVSESGILFVAYGDVVAGGEDFFFGLFGVFEAEEVGLGDLLAGAGGLDIQTPDVEIPQERPLAQDDIGDAVQGDGLTFDEKHALMHK